MSNLTVNADYKVESYPGAGLLTISNRDAVLLICMRCGNTKNIYLHEPPTESQMAQDGQLQTGSVQYPMFQQCNCTSPLPKVERDADEVIARFLEGLYKALGHCVTVAECQTMVLRLAKQQELSVKA